VWATAGSIAGRLDLTGVAELAADAPARASTATAIASCITRAPPTISRMSLHRNRPVTDASFASRHCRPSTVRAGGSAGIRGATERVAGYP
jgi:hypothetical protein